MSQRWTTIFKAFGNPNRLRMVSLLSSGPLNVTQIAKELKISLKSASKHLIILRNLEIVEYVGRHGHVLYSLSPQLPHDIYQVTRLFLK